MKALHIPLFLLISSLLPLGCNSPSTTNNSTVTTTTVTTQENNNAFSDLSIYNLPEVWTTQNGDDIALKELKGNVLVVVMIYTSCKTACPILIKDMREIRKQVDTQIPKTAKGVKYLLVSIDPETDTPEHLKAFAKENNMDDDQWLFLRSNEEQTREFAAVLAVNYKQISPVDFSHSNIISVFNKKGELVSQQEGLGIDYEKTVTEVKKQLAM
ncbi:SCO1/SenC [Capnocytophaga sp. oral taxon 332 str. F0381]|uniref:SCO family protein n=1 Tax=Capnocytophaga sp. oral taxon 332 TaxID=712213 RepID=UPI0002A38106|nr:SCO family protein [Capnocytophaga sp. oral taxon 332]EKY07449.1 SCO1/SenC [Capnocytophaga sp. oral taxon 332 str. F0381]